MTQKLAALGKIGPRFSGAEMTIDTPQGVVSFTANTTGTGLYTFPSYVGAFDSVASRAGDQELHTS